MSDSLTISGGGEVRVTTTAMTSRADDLQSLLNESAGWAGTVTTARFSVRGRDAWLDADLEALGSRLVDVEERCDSLSRGLDAAAVEYGAIEEGSRLLLQATGGISGVVLGAGQRLGDGLRDGDTWSDIGRLLFALGGGPTSPGALMLVGLLSTLITEPSAQEALKARLAADPTVIALTTCVVENADEILGWLFRLEWPLATALAAPGRDPGPEQVAAVIASAITLVRFVAGKPEYRAEARELTGLTPSAAVPSGLGDLERGLPAGEAAEAQLGVQRIGDEYIVYVRGTVDFDVNPAEPFDMGSNIELMGGEDSESVQATLDAMRRAKVPEGAKVTFVGHSQGAMVAARIAQSGRYDVHDIVSFGGPILRMDLPPDTRVISFEHEQDIIPATGGAARGVLQEPQVLHVRRELDPAALADLSGGVLPAHGLENYRDTADLADASTDERLTRYREELISRFDGPAGAVQYFTVRGVPEVSRGARKAAGGR